MHSGTNNAMKSKELKVKLKKTAILLPAIVVVSMGLLLSACGDPAGASTGSTDTSAAKNAFLADRAGTPGIDSSGTPLAGGANRVPGQVGSVEKVDGNKITIKNIQSGTESVVQLASDAKISKQATAQASDIKMGDTVTAIGTKTGDTITAETVNIGTGGFGGFGGPRGNFNGRGANGTPIPGGSGDTNGGAPSGTPGAGFGGNGGNGGSGGNRPFPRGTPGAGFGGNGQGRGNFGGANAQGTPGVPRDVATGTVQKIDGNTITLQAADGTTSTVTIASDARIQKSVDIQPADLQTGDTIFAMGQQNGDVFEATAIQVTTNFGQATPTAP
jgi:hypothetical protein